MQPIAAALATVTPGAPARFRNMTLIPLLAAEETAADYLLLDDVIARGLARVSEVSEAGRVPELAFVNEAPERVLLVDGEELVGARQNRVLNVSLLVAAHCAIRLPVSCSEQGRWHYKSRHFDSAGGTLFAKARARKVRTVSASLRERGSRQSDQAAIWDDISAKARDLRCASPTGAMSDIFEQQRARIEDYVAAFDAKPRQAGALFAIDGAVVGLELFDAPATFRKMLPRLVRSYAMDALETSPRKAPLPVGEAVTRFLAAMQAAALERFPALGDGVDLRIESETIAGGALLAGERIVHLCAFHLEAEDGGAGAHSGRRCE